LEERRMKPKWIRLGGPSRVRWRIETDQLCAFIEKHTDGSVHVEDSFGEIRQVFSGEGAWEKAKAFAISAVTV